MKNCKNQLFLIVPPNDHLLKGFPLGISALANYLCEVEKIDCDISIFDFSSFSLESVKKIIKGLKARDRLFIGITTTSASYQSSLRVAKFFKEYFPGSIIIMGGPHVSHQADVCLKNHEEVDIIVYGEGEISLSEIIRFYPDLEKVRGIFYRKNSVVVKNESPPYLTTKILDKLHEVRPSKNVKWPIPTVLSGKFDEFTYVSSRGCPHRCYFCAAGGEVIRSKSINTIINDIRYLLEKGVKRIAFEDNFFLATKNLEFFRAIMREKLNGFTWSCQTRGDSIPHELPPIMKEAGCSAVYLGIENFSKRLLFFLGKTNNPEGYINTSIHNIQLLARSGISIFINLIMGILGEEGEDMEANVKTISKLVEISNKFNVDLRVFPHLFVVYPGTYYHSLLRKMGIPANIFEIFTEQQFYFPDEFIFKNFAHGMGGIPIGILSMDSLKTGTIFYLAKEKERLTMYLNKLKEEGIPIFDYSSFLITPSQ
jgi:radical SAM superfamily enzyme YgiQ (UPF0313 family)